MKKQILSIMSVIGLLAASVTPAFSDDLDGLAGKWTTHKTNDSGESYTQQIEVTKHKFTFKISDAGGQTKLYAEGEVKVDKAGPFKVVVFSNIKAGQSATEADPIDDTFTSIYKMADDGALLLVSNFDKDRGTMKPSLDVYRKAKEARK